MGIKTVHVSDVSDVEGKPEDMGTLIVESHPGHTGLPVQLDVFPEEMESLDSAQQFAVVVWTPPGSRQGTRMVVGVDDLESIGAPGIVAAAIDRAAKEKRSRMSSSASRMAVRTPRQRPAGRSGVSYASLDHAGEPHRGRITEREKELVRENLDEINKRLSETGYRTIDLADPEMQRRYGV